MNSKYIIPFKNLKRDRIKNKKSSNQAINKLLNLKKKTK